jgi:hypothetical protein
MIETSDALSRALGSQEVWTMNLDEQLAELLGSLGVSLGGPDDETGRATHPAAGGYSGRARRRRAREGAERAGAGEQSGESLESRGETMSASRNPHDWEDEDDALAQAELSLFQTSREHYGVFYRLDLVSGAPHLRIFAPDEEGALKMRCYLVRPALGAPMREWFDSTRYHEGSEAFGESRETIEQHLLFAAGETLKRLFWSGEPERMRFPDEIDVDRVA